MTDKKLRDLDEAEHPFSRKKAYKILDQIEESSQGFLLIGHPELALHLNEAKHAVMKAYNEVRRAELEGR